MRYRVTLSVALVAALLIAPALVPTPAPPDRYRFTTTTKVIAPLSLKALLSQTVNRIVATVTAAQWCDADFIYDSPNNFHSFGGADLESGEYVGVYSDFGDGNDGWLYTSTSGTTYTYLDRIQPHTYDHGGYSWYVMVESSIYGFCADVSGSV